MSIVEKVKALAARVPEDLNVLGTEEATKNALVMPFISALGYDVFDPLEVVPEFTADVGTKKGEKVDYAIMCGEQVNILIEAKRASEKLSDDHLSQLFRYFTVTNARIAVLTNGVVYRFFSDLEEPNKMDRIPFLEIDLRQPKQVLLEEVAKLSKGAFDLEDMLSTAGDLKFTGFIRRTLEKQFEDPDEDFVKFFFAAAMPGGRFTKNAREHFSRLVSKAMHMTIADRVSLRLHAALEAQDSEPDVEVLEASEAEPERGTDIETTEEELEGYRIIKAIVCGIAPTNQIAWRDSKSYFGVLFDNNNRKPICRLWFNRSKRYVGLFDVNKVETKHLIESLEDLYMHSEQLRETVGRYLSRPDTPAVA